MARDLNCTVADLVRVTALRARIDLNKYVTATIGLPTLQDILAELAKPGRDPRQQFEPFSFAEGVSKPSDLKVGQKVNATVLEVDLTRNRIALSLKSRPDLTPRHQNAGGPRTPSQPRPQQPQSKNSNAFGSLANALDEAFKKP
jgi:uncharacterized protein